MSLKKYKSLKKGKDLALEYNCTLKAQIQSMARYDEERHIGHIKDNV